MGIVRRWVSASAHDEARRQLDRGHFGAALEIITATEPPDVAVPALVRLARQMGMFPEVLDAFSGWERERVEHAIGLLELPSLLIGRTVTRFARVLYEHQGSVDDRDGSIELELNRDHLFLLEGMSDGQRLRVCRERWEDPFAPPLSAVNQAFVDECGKWSWVDCSHRPRFADFIGQRITEACLLADQFGLFAGVRLSVATQSVWLVVEADECHLFWSLPPHITEVTNR